jgi:hypothetical protein
MAKKGNKATPSGDGVNRRQFLTRTSMGVGALMCMSSIKGIGENFQPQKRRLSPNAWSFGVMADTQWTLNGDVDDGYDPNSSTVYIAEQIQQAFINAGVKFVIHVGDLHDNTTVLGEETRALYAQSLYNAGIGFFPVRGNHDDSAAIAAAFQQVFPQTQNGIQNQTLKVLGSGFASSLNLTQTDLTNLGTPSTSRPAFTVGRNFSSPTVSYGDLTGLTYSFDFADARFVLLDQFTPPGGWPAGYDMSKSINAQQSWIGSQLQGRRVPHAFVFAHKGLVTCNHADVLFSESSGANGTPATNPAYTDAFMASLAGNNVKYFIHGHDHMHDISIVTDTNGKNAVHQLLCASDSSKFYIPKGSNSSFPQSGADIYLSNDAYYDVPAFASAIFSGYRRTPISQELNIGLTTPSDVVSRDLGFYIFTVDGPNVTADYYAVTVPVVFGSGETDLPTSPGGYQSNALTKRETFGYSLKGQEFLIASAGNYSAVSDSSPDEWSFAGTSVQILSGTNSNTITDADKVLLTKAVNTGWVPRERETISDILTLWGMGSLGIVSGGQVVANPDPDQTDVYVLQLQVDSKDPLGDFACGGASLAALDQHGRWVNAVDLNIGPGNHPKFVRGPWKSGYGLGTYGVDGNKAWAVINIQGQFAIAGSNL